MLRHTLAATSLAALIAGPAAAQTDQSAAPGGMAEATAEVVDVNGSTLGTIHARDTPSGVVSLTISLTGVPEGLHGIHIHETGDCSAADFSSAGGHLAKGKSHGIMSEDGPHPGDMPNATVQIDGALQQEYFLHGLTVAEDMLDDDGSAFVMHTGPDDYETQPAGDSGDRYACGAFRAG